MSERVAELRRAREKSHFLRLSAVVVAVGIAWAWLTGGPLLGRLPAERRWENFKNFAAELVPSPVRKSGNWSDAGPWAWELLTDEGFLALATTLGIATAAIILSASLVLPLLPLASRELSRPDPFGLWAGRTGRFRRWIRKVPGPVTRFGFVLARAVPEYIVAFLLIALLGLQVWPLVLALAIHNLGILGRLWGEVVENAEPAAARHALAAGQSREGAFLSRILPENFNRFLIYFFYRWETCVKDATVLGMLGLLTLGKLIALSKGFFWDRMFFYILLGASVILIGDLLSTFLRRKLR
ncbi:MAG: ABC transporter permease subunit [Verrucomicrobiales bacterium]|nr:ABC transporter permease subunit [Verrucomicrobiales bacterium]